MTQYHIAVFASTTRFHSRVPTTRTHDVSDQRNVDPRLADSPRGSDRRVARCSSVATSCLLRVHILAFTTVSWSSRWCRERRCSDVSCSSLFSFPTRCEWPTMCSLAAMWPAAVYSHHLRPTLYGRHQPPPLRPTRCSSHSQPCRAAVIQSTWLWLWVDVYPHRVVGRWRRMYATQEIHLRLPSADWWNVLLLLHSAGWSLLSTAAAAATASSCTSMFRRWHRCGRCNLQSAAEWQISNKFVFRHNVTT